MRTKILTLLVNVLDQQERQNPTSAATRTGMELAVIALGTILKRLEYFNLKGDYTQRLADEREVRRVQVGQLEEAVAKLTRSNDDFRRQNNEQRDKLHHQRGVIKDHEETIKNQRETLASYQKLRFKL